MILGNHTQPSYSACILGTIRRSDLHGSFFLSGSLHDSLCTRGGTHAMGRRREPRKAIEVPVRIFGTSSSGQVFSEKAVTVNVSHQGAELSGVQARINLDETIGLSYGTNRV